MKRFSREKKSVEKLYFSKTQLKNHEKNSDLFKRLFGTSNNYIINPLYVVCPICLAKIFLKDTGLLFDLSSRHMTRKGSKPFQEHQDLFTIFKRKDEDSVFTGQIKSYDASTHPSYLPVQDHGSE